MFTMKLLSCHYRLNLRYSSYLYSYYRSIGKVLPCGLTMTRITDSDLQKQGIKPSAVDATLFQSYSATNADYDYSLNINTNMWQAVFEIFKRFRQQKYTHADGLARLNTMLLTAVVREEEQENEHVYLFVSLPYLFLLHGDILIFLIITIVYFLYIFICVFILIYTYIYICLL